MTPSQLTILVSIADRARVFTTFTDAEWAVVLELAALKYVKWPEDAGGMISATAAGHGAIRRAGQAHTEAA